MALIKEPYGLVRNTDGTLCTTYRDDDIPFAGVRSFAVEPPITNLFSLPFSASAGSWDVSVPDPTGRFESVIRANPGASWIYKTISITIDSAYSSQVWCYVSPDFDGSNVRLLNEQGLSGGGWYNLGKKGTWQLLKIENKIATMDYCRYTLIMNSSSTGYVLFANPQLERYTHCTSYVEGSRPMGRIDFRNLPIDATNFVFASWVKTPPVSTSGYHHVFFYDEATVVYSIWLSLTTMPRINLTGPDSSETIWTSFYSIRDKWAFQIFMIDGNTATYRLIGEGIDAQVTNIRTSAVNINRIYWESTSGGGRLGALLSNIFIGKYRKPNGDIIWTDDYIREVYEAQMPFAVQNQLLIF